MNYKEEYNKWAKCSFLSKDLIREIESIKNDENAIKNRFSNFVEFGTAGMRGTMGVGPNRMNFQTIRRTTIGVAKFILKNKASKRGVIITYDSRINSKEFAHYIALVLSEFGILSYVSKDIRPTPFLSFAVLNMKAFLGINITASHNKKEDNGYKIYLEDGAQFSYPNDQKIIKLVNEVKDSEYFVDPKKLKPDKKLIKVIPKRVEDAFLKEATKQLMHIDFCKKFGKDLKIVYTPLHGTGYTFLEKGFSEAGFSNVYVVKSQNDKCGLFKTVSYPNPESPKAFELAIKLAKEKDADIVIANDPDADRIGVYVRTTKGKYMPLTGNELAAILCEYKVRFLKKKMDLKKDALIVKSFVTTRLLDSIAKRNDIEIMETPTGFKWICAYALKSPKKLIFAAEESYGCVLSDYVSDKDGIGTALFVAEVALALKKANFTLYQMLEMLYNNYGVNKNFAISYTYEGLDGKAKINNMMAYLRNETPKKITDIDVINVIDYESSINYDFKSGKHTKIDFPINNTLKFFLSDKSVVTIRPSGTEPKIKLYFDIIDDTEDLAINKYQILENAFKKILK